MTGCDDFFARPFIIVNKEKYERSEMEDIALVCNFGGLDIGPTSCTMDKPVPGSKPNTHGLWPESPAGRTHPLNGDARYDTNCSCTRTLLYRRE